MAQNKAIHAGLWSGIDLGARLGIQFGVSIVLARLLTPADFGIYALVLIFMAVSQVLVDGGFSTALIQRQSARADEQTSVFWYNVIVSILLAVATAIVAPFFAQAFGYPVLRHLLYVCAAIIPISALASVPTALLQRELRFDAIAKAGLVASILSGLAAVVAAVNGAGIWSFTLQASIYAAVNTCLIWLFGGWLPLRQPHLGAARQLARFGSFVALSGLLDVVYNHGASLIIGRLHGATDLGFYSRAQNLQNLPANVLAAIVTRVALPLFSGKSDDRPALKRGVRVVQGAIMMINMPLMAALATMPDLVINVLYGPKWLFAAPLLAVLAVGGVLFPLHAVNLQLILSQGRSDLFFKVEVAKKVIGITFLGIGSIYGVLGLAIGQTLFVYIAFFINAGAAGRLINYRPFEQLKDLAGTVALTLALIGILLVVRPMLAFGDLIDLAILTLIGGLFFAGAGMLLRIGVVDDVIAMTPLNRFSDRLPSLVRKKRSVAP